MHKLAQKLKNGTINIIEVPYPYFSQGSIFVRNHHSLMSADAESSTEKNVRKGPLGKTKECPQQVKQVLDVLKSQRPVHTYREVMKKLNALSPLDYSCPGKVLQLADIVSQFQTGVYATCDEYTSALQC